MGRPSIPHVRTWLVRVLDDGGNETFRAEVWAVNRMFARWNFLDRYGYRTSSLRISPKRGK